MQLVGERHKRLRHAVPVKLGPGMKLVFLLDVIANDHLLELRHTLHRSWTVFNERPSKVLRHFWLKFKIY